jgi:chemotaxis protein MotB
MRKKQEEEVENSERWMLTYLDMITLLFVLFVVLYSMANVNMSKFKALASSMSMAFGSGGKNLITSNGGGGNGIDSQSTAFINVRENNEFKSMVKLVKEYAAKQGISKKLDAKITERGLVVNLADSLLFESGSAGLSTKAQEILDRLADIIFATKKQIRVEGHTDNMPIHNAQYQSNWQLSTDRATNVIMYWISKYPDQASNLSAAGYGEFKPIASNGTPEGRTLNRRVDLVILRESASRIEVPETSSSPAPATDNTNNTAGFPANPTP